MNSKHRLTALLLAFLATGQAAYSGTLDPNAFAFNDGQGPSGGAWTDTILYDNGNNLSGSVEYAVFTAGDFNSAFPALGYTPTDAYVYAYKVTNTGTDNFTGITVGIENPASDIGQFSNGDIASSSFAFDGSGNAEWDFAPPVTTGMTSYGLAFSSPNAPMLGLALIFDGGGTLTLLDIATPGVVPEPTTASIAAWLLGGLAAFRRVRR